MRYTFIALSLATATLLSAPAFADHHGQARKELREDSRELHKDKKEMTGEIKERRKDIKERRGELREERREHHKDGKPHDGHKRAEAACEHDGNEKACAMTGKHEDRIEKKHEKRLKYQEDHKSDNH